MLQCTSTIWHDYRAIDITNIEEGEKEEEEEMEEVFSSLMRYV